MSHDDYMDPSDMIAAGRMHTACVQGLCDSPTTCHKAGYCVEAMSRGKAKAAEAEAGLGVEAAGPAAQAALLQIQGSQAAPLCVNCKHLQTNFGVNYNMRLCKRPGLPVNLVSGQHSFPAIIARGYDHLCGWRGRYWEHK